MLNVSLKLPIPVGVKLTVTVSLLPGGRVIVPIEAWNSGVPVEIEVRFNTSLPMFSTPISNTILWPTNRSPKSSGSRGPE